MCHRWPGDLAAATRAGAWVRAGEAEEGVPFGLGAGQVVLATLHISNTNNIWINPSALIHPLACPVPRSLAVGSGSRGTVEEYSWEQGRWRVPCSHSLCSPHVTVLPQEVAGLQLPRDPGGGPLAVWPARGGVSAGGWR